MSYLDTLEQYFASQFSWWYDNPFQYDPDNRTLYYYCPIPGRRERILQDTTLISQLDIGLERFIVVCSWGHHDWIKCISMNTDYL